MEGGVQFNWGGMVTTWAAWQAKGYDAQYAAARHALQAGLEKLPQGRALILPTLNLSANAGNTRILIEPNNSLLPSTLRDGRNYGYSLSFSQPIFRRQNSLFLSI